MTSLTGTATLLRLVLRRDRALMPVWILGLLVAVMSYVSSIMSVYPTAAARQGYYDINASNATFVVRNGPLSGSSLGELVAWQAGFIPVTVALFSLLTVIRHTRTEEEAGRRELTGATAIGRHAGLAAAVIAACLADAVFALLVALGMTARGLPLSGSLALGAELALAGLVFAAIGGIAAQLTWSAGGARGIAIGVLVVAFLLRAVGDSSDRNGGSAGWLAWLSPIGWAHRVRPYAGERWWVVPLAVVVTALLAATAAILSGRRDLGAGLLPARLGPDAETSSLRSPLALAWRLHRGLLLGWTACAALIGLVMGGVAQSTSQSFRANKSLEDMVSRLGGDGAVVDAYFASTMTVFALMASGYAIQATLKLRSEESSGRAEPLLATGVGRIRWAAGHFALSLLGSAVVLAAAGLTTALAYGNSTGHVGGELMRLGGAALVQLPAVWVMAAVTIALVGVLPRLASGAWGVLAAFFLLALVGAALQWNERVLELSPFVHIPKVPGGQFSAAPLLLLTLVAVAVTAAGLVALRRRDIPVG